jgi:carbonic anhydrase/acetyltransferase-like protein (isoleucine patch superfamily)
MTIGGEMPLYELEGKAPRLTDADSNWIAPDASVIGNVELGRNVGVWFGVVIRGDNDPIAIGDNSLIGMGAIVLNGAKIGRNSLVGAGALVTEGKEFPDNSLIVGAPAKAIRTLDEAAVARLRASAAHYVANARRFRAGLKPV